MRALFTDIFRTSFVYILLCMGVFLMASTIFKYFALNDHVAFLNEKQEYLDITHWKVAFCIHVFSSIFTLMAGFTQFSSSLQKQYRKLHRLIGKLYVIDILVINFPAALIMAWYA